MEIIAGYIAAFTIGILLGTLGGGGSILTIPVLVYLLKIEPVLATSYSLFIVGISALTASYYYYKNNLLDLKSAFVFSVPAFVAVFISRKWILPAIPEILLQTESYTISKGTGIMVLFSVLMFFAAFSMIKQKEKIETSAKKESKYNYPLIITEGLVVGIFTGILGAGGGFLIVPALVLFTNIPMKTAIGTSLLIIAVKSLFGFLGDLGNLPINWAFLSLFSLFTVLGIFGGVYLNKFIPSNKLKPAFGWFVLAMSVFIILKECVYINS